MSDILQKLYFLLIKHLLICLKFATHLESLNYALNVTLNFVERYDIPLSIISCSLCRKLFQVDRCDDITQPGIAG